MSQWGGCFGTVKYKTVNIMYMYNKNMPEDWMENNHLNDTCKQLCVDLYKQQENKQKLWF